MTYIATYLNALASTEKTEVMAALAAKVPVQVLGQSGVASSLAAPAHTNETVLATITIAAGTMGANDSLRLTSVWTVSNNANTKRLRARIGGIGGTAYFDTGAAITSQASYVDLARTIHNRNSVSSQVSRGGSSTGAGQTSQAVITGTVNMANAQDLVFTAQLGTGTDTITLESYCVELIRAP